MISINCHSCAAYDQMFMLLKNIMVSHSYMICLGGQDAVCEKNHFKKAINYPNPITTSFRCLFLFYLSSKAATPGNTSPSITSRLAPPPVDT
jgi:hypothetical protein